LSEHCILLILSIQHISAAASGRRLRTVQKAAKTHLFD